ncbi:MAG: hypothetical protein ACREJ3_11630 [Polyangiaceae bacterium]
MQDVEIFVPFRFPSGRAPMVTAIRSTLIVSAIQALRARGLYDSYVEQLASERRDEIASLIAGAWIPVQLGLDHYAAADRLGLDRATIESIGGDVGERVNKSMLSILVKLSKEVGVTPWSALAYAHRMRDLMWRGSDVAVLKLGPKDARFDWAGQPLSDIPYFAVSFGGFLGALAGLFCTKIYTRRVLEHCSPTSISYRLSWV